MQLSEVARIHDTRIVHRPSGMLQQLSSLSPTGERHMEPERPANSRHDSLLPLMLSVMTLGGLLLFLILVSGGFFLYVVAGVFAMFFVALMHYVTWGAI